jgi:hypothetical protein
MRGLISSLTMLSVLLHVLLGCHAHHAHAVELGHAGPGHESASCSATHEEQPSEDHDEPCDEEQCDFGDSKSASLRLESTSTGHWVFAPVVSDPSCVSRVSVYKAANDRLLPDCSRPILYCVLRN